MPSSVNTVLLKKNKWINKYLASAAFAVASFYANLIFAATFVGSDTCAACHESEYKLWQGSHHDLAMQHANADTVLGNFDKKTFENYGVVSTFYKKGDAYFVSTDGGDGALQEYPIKYVFGVEPLQQYLVEFPGGRLQALSLAWDSREQAQGGQRWFHLYPNEKIAHDDELHWTRRSQNWNNMCADCHSTNLRKNYDALTDIFNTQWSELDVACEACHGPASDHLSWANKKSGWESLAANKGLQLQLNERNDVEWLINKQTGKPQRSVPRNSNKEIEMCAHCHARRSPLTKNYRHGDQLLDHYLPSLLSPVLYHADGQINDEVYVYGSFIQSKMYEAGVTCSDCHEPHSLQPKLPGNGVCLQCHQADQYDTAEHHFHEANSASGSCVECHMPAKNFMVVDARHDHSIRIPRPDMSQQLGVPNACNNCHSDKTVGWAVNQVKKWYGGIPEGLQHYTTTIAAARSNQSNAVPELVKIIDDASVPAIARATALAELAPSLNADTLSVLRRSMQDDDPLVRVAAVTALEYAPLNIRAGLVLALLNDPVRAVRIESGRVLAGFAKGQLPKRQRRLLTAAWQEYINAQMASAERPEAQVNLGNFYAAQGNIGAAQKSYETAIELDRQFVPAYVNLADAYRNRGMEQAAFDSLQAGVKVAPENASLQHALGLSLVRQKKTEAALMALHRAAQIMPSNARYAYVYAVALSSAGEPQKAIAELQRALEFNPHNTDILAALVAYNRELGNVVEAAHYQKALQAKSPH
jgi:tetratricopeptide (TPR) repeat protein